MPKNPVTTQEKLNVLNMMYGETIGTNEGDAIISGINTVVMDNIDGKRTLSKEARDHQITFWFYDGVKTIKLNEIEIFKGLGWQIKFINILR